MRKLRSKAPCDLPAGSSVLGLESSCDDTAAALFVVGKGTIAHKSLSQASVHREYGGVVPELAARDHVARMLPLVRSVLGDHKPQAVACTSGPGLPGCLVAGTGLAQSLAYAWGVPLARVNHLEGHILSPFLERRRGFDFPYLALLVSGGHTAIYDVTAPQCYRQLGITLDDAIGEAFDKTGILLGLGFPGGPQLERLAKSGNAGQAPMQPAMHRHKGFDMSFSGLKTMARRSLQEGKARQDVAASFQQAAVETVANKVTAALRHSKRKRLAVVGGVSRNLALRKRLAQAAKQHDAKLYHPPMRWCTDNAAMIAYAGLWRLRRGYSTKIRPRWPIGQESH